jgi:peptidoglycan/LPS O-acetylase OafA/YrhL
MKQQRVIFLDILRIIAMSLIVWFHIALTLNIAGKGGVVIPKFYYASLGNIGVTLFIILSGLALEHTYGGKRLKTLPFLIKRLKKIFPLYWLTLILVVGFHWLRDNVFFPASALSATLTPTELLCTITATCSLIGRWGGPFIRASWFLGTIMVLYLHYPVLSRFLARWRHAGLLVLFLLSVLARFLVTRTTILQTDPLEWFPYTRIFEFGLGIFLASRLPASIKEFRVTERLQTAIVTLSDLTFPLFLVHHELDFVLLHLHNTGWSHTQAILLYLILSLGVSFGVQKLLQKLRLI